MTADNVLTLWVSMGVENGQLYVSCELLPLGIVAQGATLRGTGVWGHCCQLYLYYRTLGLFLNSLTYVFYRCMHAEKDADLTELRDIGQTCSIERCINESAVHGFL